MTDEQDNSNASENETHGSRLRSPNYPFFPLEQALRDAETIYSKDKTMAVPMASAATHLGYSNPNGGMASRRLSSLRQYGLVESPQTGKIKVSQLFMKYRFAATPDEAYEALKTALMSPVLFQDIISKCGGPENLPSDQTLMSMLVLERGFNSDMVEKAVQALKQSFEFVASKKAPDQKQLENSFQGAYARTSTPPVNTHQASTSTKQVFSSANESADSIPIRLPGNRRALLVLPAEFNEEDREIIKRHLDAIYVSNEKEPTKS